MGQFKRNGENGLGGLELVPSWVLVAHACNPSYSGGRDQEDQGSKPAQANSSQDSILKNTHHEKGLVEWLKVQALSSNPSTTKKKKKKKNWFPESPDLQS
jgi:hypothetical protein